MHSALSVAKDDHMSSQRPKNPNLEQVCMGSTCSCQQHPNSLEILHQLILTYNGTSPNISWSADDMNSFGVESPGTHAKTIEQVKSYQLKLPVSQRENMSIQTVKKGDQYKYYLIAALSETGWWDRQSVLK